MPSLREQAKTLSIDRRKVVADARKIVDAAEAEKRDMSAEEKEQWNSMMETVDKLQDRIDAMERQASAEDEDSDEDDKDGERDNDEESSEPEDEEDDEESEEGERSMVRLPDGRMARVVKPGSRRRGSRPRPGKNGAVNGEIRRRLNETESEFRTRQRRSSPEYREAFWAYFTSGPAALTGRHARAIQADLDIVGGYLVAPQEFVAQLIKFVDNLLFIRQKATKFTLTAAQSLGAPSLDADPADADWTAELNTGNEDSTMAFGKRELTPYPLAKRLKVSNKLIRMASVSGTFSNYDAQRVGSGPEQLVQARLGYKFTVAEEKAFQLGSGSQQPLGLFTASSRGISTARDVVTGSTTGYTADQLIAAKYTLKQQYMDSCEWLFHRDSLKLIRQLKDGNGQYLWAPGLAGAKPDTLLDRPINMSEYCPNTFTTGQYVGLLADFKFYWIADAETLQIQRLVELYAEANQIGFIARMELDGMPVLEEAFVRLKTS